MYEPCTRSVLPQTNNIKRAKPGEALRSLTSRPLWHPLGLLVELACDLTGVKVSTYYDMGRNL
jgi:hypothetical protein